MTQILKRKKWLNSKNCNFNSNSKWKKNYQKIKIGDKNHACDKTIFWESFKKGKYAKKQKQKKISQGFFDFFMLDLRFRF